MPTRHYSVKKDTMLGKLLGTCDIPLGGKVVPIDEAPIVVSDTRNMREGALGGFLPIHTLDSDFLSRINNTLLMLGQHALTPGAILEHFRLFFSMPNMDLPLKVSRASQRRVHSVTVRPIISCNHHRAAKGAPGFVYDFLVKVPLNANRFSEPYILSHILETYPLPFDIYDEEKTHAKEIAFHVRIFSQDHEAYKQFPSGILYFPKHYHIDTQPIATPLPFLRL